MDAAATLCGLDPVPVMRHTCVGDGGVLVEGHQGRIQQDDVGVLGDHPVVRRLDPRLVLVHCGRERKKENVDILLLGYPLNKSQCLQHVFLPCTETIQVWFSSARAPGCNYASGLK